MILNTKALYVLTLFFSISLMTATLWTNWLEFKLRWWWWWGLGSRASRSHTCLALFPRQARSREPGRRGRWGCWHLRPPLTSEPISTGTQRFKHHIPTAPDPNSPHPATAPPPPPPQPPPKPPGVMAFTLSEIMAARRQQSQAQSHGQRGGRTAVEVDEYSTNPTQAFTFYNINQGRFQPPHVHMWVSLRNPPKRPPHCLSVLFARIHGPCRIFVPIEIINQATITQNLIAVFRGSTLSIILKPKWSIFLGLQKKKVSFCVFRRWVFIVVGTGTKMWIFEKGRFKSCHLQTATFSIQFNPSNFPFFYPWGEIKGP